MPRRSYIVAALAGAAIAWYLYAEYGERPLDAMPIAIVDGTIVVRNDTDREWRNVVVTVNHHFHGGTRSLAAGGRLNAPVSEFTTGHGQRFDRSRQTVFRIEVTATDSEGQAVRREWATRQAK